MTSSTTRAWPALPLEAWRDTYATLHMWTQVVGKLCLALTARSNHFWNIAFHVASRGLATPTLTIGGHSLMITFDFVSHQLVFQCSDGRTETIALEPRTAASPENELTAFFECTYDLAARLASWNRVDLEQKQDTTK